MEKEELKQLILDKRKEGQVVVMGLEGPMSMPLEDIIRQPVDGLLYDLNRLEELALTFIDDQKWVNDFAVALVIRKLKSNLDELKAENKRLRDYVQHKPGCWKNQALEGLGVGGKLASCTCGLDKALGGE